MNRWNQPINIQTYGIGGGLRRGIKKVGKSRIKVKTLVKPKANVNPDPKIKPTIESEPTVVKPEIELKPVVVKPTIDPEPVVVKPEIELAVEQPKVDQVKKFPNLTGLIEKDGEYFFANKKGTPKKKANVLSHIDPDGEYAEYWVNNKPKWYSLVKRKGYNAIFRVDKDGKLSWIEDSRGKKIEDKFEKFNFNKRKLTPTGYAGITLGIPVIPKTISYLYQKSDRTATPQKSYTPYVDQGEKQEEKLPDSIYTKPLTNEEALELLMNL